MRFIPEINRDPKILPFVARLYIVGCMMIIMLISILLNSTEIKKLSACGVVLGVFGSGILYWETVASNNSLLSISNEVERSAENSKISTYNTITVMLFANIGFFLLFLLPATVIFSRYRLSNDMFYTIKSISLISLVSASPALSVYAFQKITRRWGISWLTKFRRKPECDRVAYIKESLRRTGFAALFASGAMQLPAALF